MDILVYLDMILFPVVLFLFIAGNMIAMSIALIFFFSWIICSIFKLNSNKKKETISGVVLGIICSLVILIWPQIIFGSGPKHPSDVHLIHNYNNNKEVFNLLVEKIHEDKGIKRIDNDWTDPEDLKSIGISKEELNEYRNTFQLLKIPRGFYNFDSDGIKFIASSYGMAFTSSSSKGYFYVQGPLNDSRFYGPIVNSTDEFSSQYPDEWILIEPLVGEIDDYWSDDKKVFRCYREIDDNWYIYFRYHDN